MTCLDQLGGEVGADTCLGDEVTFAATVCCSSRGFKNLLCLEVMLLNLLVSIGRVLPSAALW